MPRYFSLDIVPESELSIFVHSLLTPSQVGVEFYLCHVALAGKMGMAISTWFVPEIHLGRQPGGVERRYYSLFFP